MESLKGKHFRSALDAFESIGRAIDGETIIAVLFHVSEDCLSRVRKAVNIHTSVFDSAITERRIA
jgi:hypothetical protein